MKLMYKEIEKWTLARSYDEIFDAVMDYNENVDRHRGSGPDFSTMETGESFW